MSDSDEISSGTDDDDILNAIMKGSAKPRKPPTPAPATTSTATADSDDEVSIPTVFLTQGAKNTSLLKKANEISQHIKEEQEKTTRQLEELGRLKREILEELNDNGSALTYTYKSANDVIEEYIQHYYANHYSLRAHRHFYFFGDVYRVELGDVSDEKGTLIDSMGLSMDESLFPAYNRALAGRGVTKEDVAFWCIGKCLDETLLEDYLRFLQQYKPEDDGKPVMGIEEALEKVSGTKPAYKMPLKIRHFNNNVRLSILRASMLFLAYSPSTDRVPYILCFFLASSDFYANKHCRDSLIEFLMKPTFSKIAAEDSSKAIYDTFLALKPHYYGKEPDENYQKHYELIFNFLSNLHSAFKHTSGSENATLVSLSRSFLLDDFHPSTSPFSIDEITSILNDSLPRSPTTVAQHSTLANPIYKYVFKTRICTRLLTEMLYSDLDKKPFLTLHIQLQSLKDRLQQDMSHWLFLSNDIPYKADVSAGLSEAYHALDHFSTVLNKNLSLIQKDIFYEDP
ncbi:hypothetical protein FT662_01530 [Candidozyma haemuli var. vulneris]|uniref:Uncharacterized protein n=1 Tax=Candidozyma haemuli TaxID=45357 RepID=A0A2V1ATG7_9ASCO|nr:hypothetical protein CXQ85_004314 [[Candida] haemuloni]KAF3991776.1 hypothetical protein FT662_01530 [[Candida] haemuloni var. vulneris]PVH20806.1 hypothetical protein CXQ85_004314 [[Candida] haemuloni]